MNLEIFGYTLSEVWQLALSNTAVHIALLTYGLWVFYLAIMNLQRAYEAKTISKLALAAGIPILIVGLILDTLVNILVMTVLFLEIPKEFLVTSRLQRHVKTSTGYRQKLAWFICHHLLDAFDPSGKHC